VNSVKRPVFIAARLLLISWLIPALLLAERRRPTVAELRADPNLTPKKLMSHCARFKFELRAEVQPPEMFLASETGDCDDFAIAAATLLREKGYTPRLFSVRMPGLTHVVCYINETRSYMDYNNRIYFRPLVKCAPTVNDIADRVADSFDSSWTSASEFVYTNDVKILVNTVARAEAFASSPFVANQTVRQLDISF